MILTYNTALNAHIVYYAEAPFFFFVSSSKEE